MGKDCRPGLYWDALVKNCVDCHLVCQRPQVIGRCIRHCVSADCKALPGYYYDALLKMCVNCAEVCGRHPHQCSGYCPTQLLPVTTKTLLDQVTLPALGSTGFVNLTTLDSTLLLYFLLALSIVLLLSSLSLALCVFLQWAKSSNSSTAVPEVNSSNKKVVVDVGQGGDESGRSIKGFVRSSSHPPEHEPLDDSSPTETCVCVHCFPDLKALSQGHTHSLRTPLPTNHQGVLQGAQTQNGQRLWTQEGSHSSSRKVHVEASVG